MNLGLNKDNNEEMIKIIQFYMFTLKRLRFLCNKKSN